MPSQSDARSGPFIVTTKRRDHTAPYSHPHVPITQPLVVRSRVAVATLSEARDAAIAATRNAGSVDVMGPLEASLVPASGGTVGPLPDGTVIEVERTNYNRIAFDSDWPFPPNDSDYSSAPRHGAEVLAHYNAKQASHAD